MIDLFSGEDHIVVVLDEVSVNISCSLHPWERHPERPTRLFITARLYAPDKDCQRYRDHTDDEHEENADQVSISDPGGSSPKCRITT